MNFKIFDSKIDWRENHEILKLLTKTINYQHLSFKPQFSLLIIKSEILN